LVDPEFHGIASGKLEAQPVEHGVDALRLLVRKLGLIEVLERQEMQLPAV
jgi:hypothetical protein